MADWTTPAQRVTGDLVTATIYNEQIMDNLTYLYDRASVGMAGYENVSNTAVETAIGSYAIAANALGTYGMVKAEWWFLIYNTSGALATTVFEVYFGSTSLFDDTFNTNDASYGMAYVSCWVTNTGATNTQLCCGHWQNDQTGVVAGSEVGWDDNLKYYNTAAIDTTAATVLEAHVTLSAAHANYGVKLMGSALLGPVYLTS